MSDIVLSSKDYVDNNAGGSKFISDFDNTLKLGTGKDGTHANYIEIGEYDHEPAILIEDAGIKITSTIFHVGPDTLFDGFISSNYIREDNDAIHLGSINHSIYISGPICPASNVSDKAIQLGATNSTEAIIFKIDDVTLRLDSVDLLKLRAILDQTPTLFTTGPANLS